MHLQLCVTKLDDQEDTLNNLPDSHFDDRNQ